MTSTYVTHIPHLASVTRLNRAFQFNGGWPLDLTTAAAPGLLGGGTLNFDQFSAAQQGTIASDIGSFTVDDEHITQLGLVANSAHTYMTAVAPWFFTHFDSKNVSP